MILKAVIVEYPFVFSILSLADRDKRGVVQQAPSEAALGDFTRKGDDNGVSRCQKIFHK